MREPRLDDLEAMDEFITEQYPIKEKPSPVIGEGDFQIDYYDGCSPRFRGSLGGMRIA